MLKSQNSGGHEHCHLLAVVHCFKRGANSNLSLTKADISTDETIHGLRALHVFFNVICR